MWTPETGSFGFHEDILIKSDFPRIAVKLTTLKENENSFNKITAHEKYTLFSSMIIFWPSLHPLLLLSLFKDLGNEWTAHGIFDQFFF